MAFFVFGIKVQLLTNFSIFREIKLKFNGGVNYKKLISYFMSVLPYKVNLIKIKGFYTFFYQKFIQPLLNKSVAMVTHKLILKVKKFQLCNAKRFGTVEENLQGVDSTPPYYLGLKLGRSCVLFLRYRKQTGQERPIFRKKR